VEIIIALASIAQRLDCNRKKVFPHSFEIDYAAALSRDTALRRTQTGFEPGRYWQTLATLRWGTICHALNCEGGVRSFKL
jgi:hypothetical protein